MRLVELIDLGLIDYKAAWDMQELILNKMVEEKSATKNFCLKDTLIFCEHPSVYTIGKSGNEKNILITEEEMNLKNIQYFKSNRGGDITFHGLGQLVVYPIFDLEAHKPDIGLYIRNLEEVVIQTLATFNIQSGRNKGETGVWIEPEIEGKERKICAIGVRCSRWITMHGLALNINTDLSYFNHIIPCGIQNKKVTSMQSETKKLLDIEEIKKIVFQNFSKVFQLFIKKNKRG